MLFVNKLHQFRFHIQWVTTTYSLKLLLVLCCCLIYMHPVFILLWLKLYAFLTLDFSVRGKDSDSRHWLLLAYPGFPYIRICHIYWLLFMSPGRFKGYFWFDCSQCIHSFKNCLLTRFRFRKSIRKLSFKFRPWTNAV